MHEYQVNGDVSNALFKYRNRVRHLAIDQWYPPYLETLGPRT